MNLPTIIGAILILGVVISIIARGIHNKRTHKGGGCGCGCSGCPSNGMCHPK